MVEQASSEVEKRVKPAGRQATTRVGGREPIV